MNYALSVQQQTYIQTSYHNNVKMNIYKLLETWWL